MTKQNRKRQTEQNITGQDRYADRAFSFQIMHPRRNYNTEFQCSYEPFISYGSSDMGTSYPVAKAQENSTGERRSQQHCTRQNRSPARKGSGTKAAATRATYNGSSVVTECLFLLLFPFFSSSALCNSFCCTAT